MSKKTKKLDPLFERKDANKSVVNVSARLPAETVERFNALNKQLAGIGLHIPLKSVIETGINNAIALQEKALEDAKAEQPTESVQGNVHDDFNDSGESADD